MGGGVFSSYCEEIPVEENEVNDSSSKSSIETKPDASPQLPKKSITNSTLTSTGSSEAPVSVWVRSSGQIPALMSGHFLLAQLTPHEPHGEQGSRKGFHVVTVTMGTS